MRQRMRLRLLIKLYYKKEVFPAGNTSFSFAKCVFLCKTGLKKVTNDKCARDIICYER